VLSKIITIILNYIVTYLIIPVSWVVVDFFRMKKTIKQINIENEELKKAVTLKDKIIASNNIS
jgi:hypothetical protein